MEIAGRNYGFMLTAGAAADLADMCPDGDISRMGELMADVNGKSLRDTAKVLAILSAGYEDNRQLMEPGYEPHPLTERMVLAMSMQQIRLLQDEAMGNFGTDAKTTVELADDKKKEAAENTA